MMQPRAVETRSAIVEAAAAVFDDRGYVPTTMDAVAERAGVTKGALYFHFASKKELAAEVIRTQHDVSRQYGERAFARGATALERMMWISQGLATQMITEVVVSAGIRLSTESGSTEVERQDPYTDWMQVAAQLMAMAIAEGDVDPSWDPELVGRVVIPAYTGVQLVSDVLADRADLYLRLQDLWRVLLAAIVTERVRPDVERLVGLIAPE